MSVTLSSNDVLALQEVARVLAAPFAYADVDDWRSAVNEGVCALVGGDSAGFLLPVPGRLALYSDQHDPAELARYPDLPPPPAADGEPVWDKLTRVGVGTLATFYEDELPRYLSSPYYNEFAAPNKGHDTLAVSVPVCGGAPGLASLHVWHERPDGRCFGERDMTLLRLLFPAFQAGVESYLCWGREGGSLLRTLEDLGQSALIGDLTGRVVHRTVRLEAVLKADPEGECVNAALQAVLLDVTRTALGTGEPSAGLTRRVHTQAAEYRVRGCLAGGPPSADPTYAVVGVERRVRALPTVESLRQTFGLTRRQGEVALLLARRFTNAEIAAELCVSLPTARHHVEHVLSRMNVPRTRIREVVGRVVRGPQGRAASAGNAPRKNG